MLRAVLRQMFYRGRESERCFAQQVKEAEICIKRTGVDTGRQIH